MTLPTSGPRLSRWLHKLFEATLLVKGSLAASEALAGLGLLVTANHVILSLVGWLTRNDIAQHPGEGVTRWMEQAVQAFPIETQHFYAMYLMAHGGLKLAMVILLARRVIWAYPAAVALLLGFITYQLHHWTQEPSPTLLILSAFDAFMIGLVIREYKALRLGQGGMPSQLRP